jgi:hypothetical protein
MGALAIPETSAIPMIAATTAAGTSAGFRFFSIVSVLSCPFLSCIVL